MPQSPISILLAFASSLDFTSSTLIPDLRTRIPVFPIENVQAKHRTALDTQGTELWNLATRQSRVATVTGDEFKTKIALLRVFAFGLLDAAALSRNGNVKKPDTCVRMLKVTFKCLKMCLEAGELEFAGKVAQRAAWWIDEGEGVVDEDVWGKLGGEYFIWRLALAWKQDKLDVAEHMYEKFWASGVRPDCNNTEDLADVLFELGNTFFGKKHYELAATWLERALDAIDIQELDMLSDDASELRLAIMQRLFKSLLSIKTPAAVDKAKHIVGIIDHSFSDKLIAMLFKLELLSIEESPSASDYFDVVSKMIRTVTLTKSNFKTIMHHVHKLKKLSTALASKALDDLITLRLSRDAKDEWVERACMTRIWIMTAVTADIPDFDTLKEILDEIYKVHSNPFSAAAAHAAQTLLWKHIESSYSEKQYESAERYCELAVHDLFQKCGELNHAKISRKRILCAINRGDETAAREVYFRLPESQRNAPETRYLMHKVAMRTGDSGFAAECLDLIAKQSGKCATRLYACVLDALQIANEEHALLALQKVLETYNHQAPGGVHLPALLRCMIRLVRSNLKVAVDDSVRTNEAIGTICTLFEAAVKYAKRSATTENNFNTEELGWFSKNSYNMAAEYLERAHPSLLYRLSLACSQLIGMLDCETPPAGKAKLRVRHIVCEYLALTVVVVLARNEDNIENSLNHYKDARKHAQKLRQLIADQMETDELSDTVKANLVAKHIQSVKFELETILRLNKWDELSEIFDQCWKYEDPKRWDTLADLAFSIHEDLCTAGPELLHVHQKTILQFIERVVSKSWKPNEPVDKLAKHLRCLFHLALGKDDTTAANCMDQVIYIAEISKMSKTPYPPNELEWMAATTFNQAVSYFCVKDDTSCQFWAEKALNLSAHAADGGAFANVLRENYAKLRLTGE